MRKVHNVTDDAPMYRLIIETKMQKQNPLYDWHTCHETGEKPYVYSDDTKKNYYGPYTRLGIAKQQLTVHRRDGRGGFRDDIVSYDIQLAHVVWESVPVTLDD